MLEAVFQVKGRAMADKKASTTDSITQKIEKLAGGKVFVICQKGDEVKSFRSHDFEIPDILWNFEMMKHQWCRSVWEGDEEDDDGAH